MIAALAALTLLSALHQQGQQPSQPAVHAVTACASADQRQFDFWLGDWDVFDTATRQKAGRNLVTAVLDGCALQEHWTGVDGDTGTSLNTYFAGDRRWHQTWVDNHGGLLRLDGRFESGRMSLSGARTTRNGQRVIDRIVWTLEPNGDVRQVWDSSGDHGTTWRNVFDGTYVKRR